MNKTSGIGLSSGLEAAVNIKQSILVPSKDWGTISRIAPIIAPGFVFLLTTNATAATVQEAVLKMPCPCSAGGGFCTPGWWAAHGDCSSCRPGPVAS